MRIKDDSVPWGQPRQSHAEGRIAERVAECGAAEIAGRLAETGAGEGNRLQEPRLFSIKDLRWIRVRNEDTRNDTYMLAQPPHPS